VWSCRRIRAAFGRQCRVFIHSFGRIFAAQLAQPWPAADESLLNRRLSHTARFIIGAPGPLGGESIKRRAFVLDIDLSPDDDDDDDDALYS